MMNIRLVVKLNAGNIAEIVDTAATLSPESSFSNYKIYLKKDTLEEPYVGDSQNLAYLLALIHCGRELRLSHRDIWSYLEHREHRTKHAVETG